MLEGCQGGCQRWEKSGTLSSRAAERLVSKSERTRIKVSPFGSVPSEGCQAELA